MQFKELKKTSEKWMASADKAEKIKNRIYRDINYSKRVDEEINRITNDRKKNGYHLDHYNIIDSAKDAVYNKYVKNNPDYSKARKQYMKDISDYHNEIENATKTILGKYGNRPISVGDSIRSRTYSAEYLVDRYLKRGYL